MYVYRLTVIHTHTWKISKSHVGSVDFRADRFSYGSNFMCIIDIKKRK